MFLYLWFVASDNVETQRKGTVIVAWPRLPENRVSGSRFIPAATAPYWWKNFVDSVPVRICAFHLCNIHGGNFLKIVFAALGAVLTTERIRMKIHSGTCLIHSVVYAMLAVMVWLVHYESYL